jgi:hypothetical protein
MRSDFFNSQVKTLERAHQAIEWVPTLEALNPHQAPDLMQEDPLAPLIPYMGSDTLIVQEVAQTLSADFPMADASVLESVVNELVIYLDDIESQQKVDATTMLTNRPDDIVAVATDHEYIKSAWLTGEHLDTDAAIMDPNIISEQESSVDGFFPVF